MLIAFRVENFRSFGPPAELSMVAAPIEGATPELDANNVIAVQDVRLLKSAAIYGANASGKSNLVGALEVVRDMVLHSSGQIDKEIDVEPYRLSGKFGPSRFEVVFVRKGREYRYGFEADSDNIVEEWLYCRVGDHEATYFERVGKTITLDSDFHEEGKGLADRTRENALFLSVVAQFNGSIATLVWEWFRDLFVMSGLDDSAACEHTERMLKDEADRAEIVKLVKSLDLGIDDIVIESRSPIMSGGKRLFISPGPYTKYPKTEIWTIHPSYDADGQPDKMIRFELEIHESQGTQKMFALAGPLLTALRQGSVMVIDEFDARLHPLLTRQLVGLFHDPRTNPNGAQLVFTTHDTNLLDASLFRRDQIWFIEKDRRGASHLYSLAEYKVQGDDYERRYVEGRYGAIPYLSFLRHVRAEIGDG